MEVCVSFASLQEELEEVEKCGHADYGRYPGASKLKLWIFVQCSPFLVVNEQFPVAETVVSDPRHSANVLLGGQHDGDANFEIPARVADHAYHIQDWLALTVDEPEEESAS
jgi:hypothetical protein